MTFSNQLSDAETERLALLCEECGETLQAIGKILRHGYESVHPTDPYGFTNRHMLEKELGDVKAAMMLMAAAGDIDKHTVNTHANDKLRNFARWQHHQRELLEGMGILT